MIENSYFLIYLKKIHFEKGTVDQRKGETIAFDSFAFITMYSDIIDFQ